MYSGVHVRYPRTSRDTLGLGHMEIVSTEVWDISLDIPGHPGILWDWDIIMEIVSTEVWDVLGHPRTSWDTLGLGHMEMMCTAVWDTLGLEIVYTALGVGYPWTSQDIQGYSGTGT